MHPITLLQNTPVEDIKDFCENNNYGLCITGTGDLILVHQKPVSEKPKSYINMANMTLSALQELSELVSLGYEFEITKAIDGTDIILATNCKGYARIFQLNIYQEEQE